MDIYSTLQELIRSTEALHGRFNVPKLSIEESDKRLRLQMEELGEMAKAINLNDGENIMEEATDVAVVAIGTLLLFGTEVIPYIKQVIIKNDSKGLDTHKYFNGKIIKLNGNN